jgi:hypothetical protein
MRTRSSTPWPFYKDSTNRSSRNPALPQSLSGQAQFLRARLLGSAAYLSNLAHRIAFIGTIGDGKTTAICFLSGLTRPSQKQPRDLRDECLLATQRSRTTLCEVTVRGEAAERGASTLRFRIAVEPTPNEEIYRLVREWAIDLWDRRTGTKRSPEESRGLSIEIERALREPPRRSRAREKRRFRLGASSRHRRTAAIVQKD